MPTATPGARIVSDTRYPLAPDALRVVVSVTGTCPYGIGACWGGADEALRHLEGVLGVAPYPDAATSTAVVHLEDGRLPDRRPHLARSPVGQDGLCGGNNSSRWNHSAKRYIEFQKDQHRRAEYDTTATSAPV